MISRSRLPSTPNPRSRSPRNLPGDLEAKRDALAAVLATAAGVEPSAVALSIDGSSVSADITVQAEDADATRASLSAGLFARAKQCHESGASQFDKPTARVRAVGPGTASWTADERRVPAYGPGTVSAYDDYY